MIPGADPSILLLYRCPDFIKALKSNRYGFHLVLRVHGKAAAYYILLWTGTYVHSTFATKLNTPTLESDGNLILAPLSKNPKYLTSKDYNKAVGHQLFFIY